jgi:branched-subunit amino acid ABC-type transport system permease component
MYFLMTTIMLMEIYAIVALSLNLLLGVAGRFSAYEAAIMGIGAYTAALLGQALGLDLLWGCIVGAVFCALMGIIFQIMTRYMDFFTFKITSFALQMALWQTFMTWRNLTGGANGIYGIDRPNLFGISFENIVAYFCLTTALSLLVIGYLLYFERSQFALALRGLRDGEDALETLGKNPFALKLKVFALSGAAVGFAGGLLAGLLPAELLRLCICDFHHLCDRRRAWKPTGHDRCRRAPDCDPRIDQADSGAPYHMDWTTAADFLRPGADHRGRRETFGSVAGRPDFPPRQASFVG